MKRDPHEKDLEAALKAARSALKKKASAENVRAVEAGRKALKDYRAEKAAVADPAERRFTTQAEVRAYLQGEGWKIGKSKLSADWKLIPRQKDGTVLARDADKYADLVRLTRKENTAEGAEKAAIKVDWEEKIAEEKHKKLKYENEVAAGRWVLKSDVSRMLAARASALMNGVGPEFIHANAPDIVKLVGGQAEKIPDLIDYWLGKMEEHFNRYSRPLELAVPAGAPEEPEEPLDDES